MKAEALKTMPAVFAFAEISPLNPAPKNRFGKIPVETIIRTDVCEMKFLPDLRQDGFGARDIKRVEQE